MKLKAIIEFLDTEIKLETSQYKARMLRAIKRKLTPKTKCGNCRDLWDSWCDYYKRRLDYKYRDYQRCQQCLEDESNG